jgi:hypothetical protein
MLRAILGWILVTGALTLLYVTLYVGLRMDGTLERHGHQITSRSAVLSALFLPLCLGEGLGWKIASWFESHEPAAVRGFIGQ